ncbi:PIG-L deacetylase family protein [Bacillus cereus]|uniref:PIG-L deacetylase family protein n=1 Tax=Bacillus cereus TaxID=1396 RepID=UPI00065B4A8E|nr:PIG-L deacetylase family protein [Bacillus cereus]KMQ32183.1 hypothetical protein TU58_01475 [Bacillus cereus]
MLVVAPHPDDETIGCGGTILRLLEKGVDVRVLILTYNENSVRGKEAVAAMNSLGITEYAFLDLPDGNVKLTWEKRNWIENWLKEWEPTSWFVPHGLDPHPDHRSAYEITHSLVKSNQYVYFYEVWSPLPVYNCSVDITISYPRKERALAYYESQEERHYIIRSASTLTQFRGSSRPIRKCERAEVFFVSSGAAWKLGGNLK